MPTVSQSDAEASPTRTLLGNWSTVTVLVALCIAALMAAGCGPAVTGAGSGPTQTPRPSLVPTPTDIALQGPPLQWTAGSLPPGNHADGPGFLNVPEVALNDGNTAYICAYPTSTSVGAGVWVTHDRARRWTRLADLPFVPHQLTRCRIIPDAVDPAIVSAMVSWTPMKENPPPYVQVDNFASFDGGQHWQSSSGPQPFAVEWTATYHSTTMAVLATPATYSGLWISHDQLQTWQRVSPGMNIDVSSLAINPSNGQLIQFGGNTGSTVPLEESDDDGQHWTTISTPLPSSPPPGANMPDWGASYLISLPAPGQPWRICGPGQDPGPDGLGVLECSLDGGRTWTKRPRLVLYDYNGYITKFPQVSDEFAVGPDGTIFAQPVGGSGFGFDIPPGIYELAPGANRWQSLGPDPDASPATVEILGVGILWDGADSSGGVGLFPDAAA